MKTNLAIVDDKFKKNIKIPKIICSVHQWKNMDREEATQKECRERKINPTRYSKLQKKLNNLITLKTE